MININTTKLDTDELSNLASFDKYLQTGKTEVQLAKNIYLLFDSDYWMSLHNSIITPFLFNEFNDPLTANTIKKKFQGSKTLIPAAVVLKNKTIVNPNINLLVNADEGDPCPITNLTNVDNLFPSISFRCLRQSYPKKTIPQLAKDIVDGKLKVCDFTPNQTITSKKSPGLGFTKIDTNLWHMPSTVLLYDTVNKFTLLFGMDEGSYFGVELSTNVKTIEKAFLDLTPPQCRGIIGVERQGEWFARPEKLVNIPSISECDLEIEDLYKYVVSLPRDSEQSSRHHVHCAEGRLKNGILYAEDPALYHEEEQHETLDLDGWYSFHKNTAKRSFSVQGVD
jgi:hypothetical protein